MRKSFVGNLLFLLFLNALVKPFWIFGIDRSIQNLVGPNEYGFYYALLNFSYLLNIFLDFGTSNYNNRTIAQNPKEIQQSFETIFSLRLLFGLVFYLVAFTVALLIGYNSAQLKMLFVLAFNQFLISSVLYLRSNISALHLFKLDSLLSVLDRVLMIAGGVVLVWVHPEYVNIYNFVYLQTAAYALTFAVALWAVLSQNVRFKFSFKRNEFKRIIKLSAPFALLTLIMSAYTRVDSVMLERMLPEGAYFAGIYAQSYRILEAFNMLGFLTASLLLPMFSGMLFRKESIVSLFQLAIKLILIPALGILMVAFFFHTNIIELLYHSVEANSDSIFIWLMLSFVFTALGYITGPLLTADGQLKMLNGIAITSLVLNLVLNALLIPKYQGYGAAVASAVSVGLSFVLQFLLIRKKFNLPFNFLSAVSLIGFLGLSIGASYAITWSDLNWQIQALLIVASVSVSALVTRFLAVSEAVVFVKNALKNKLEN